MSRQEIDIGIQGNDGTGDSIRDSFRKVNENFQEIYAVFGAGDTIGFTALGDTPDSYDANQVFITGYSNGKLGILAKTLTATGGVQIDNSRAGELRLVGDTSSLEADTAPQLGGALNVRNLAIGNIPDPSDALVASFNATYSNIGITTTKEKMPISKGYADTHYVGKGAGNVVNGALRLRDEPLYPEITDASYDPTLTSNYLSNEALPRKNVVYRGGDTMTGKLSLSDHPAPVAGYGTPNGTDDLQAATKFYVDNEVYVSATNIYVRTNGDDLQLKTPLGREGRNWAHAYKTIGAAALQAENLINLASQEPGPYRQKISYTISPNQFNSVISGDPELTGGNSDNDGYKDAAELLRLNKTFIQAETIAYINNKYVNSFSYDQEKCQRDVQIILNAIGTDLVIGSNYNSLQAATAYFEKQSATVISTQLIQTIDAINYAKDQIIAFSYSDTNLTSYLNDVIDALNLDMAFNSNYQSVLMARYFPYANTGLSVTEIVGTLTELQTRLVALSVNGGNQVDAAANSFKANITSMITIVQGGDEPTLQLPKLLSTSVAKQSARTLLINNISFIQSEIIAWLAANYPKLNYSQTTCKRDVKYIVEALAYDQLYGGNSKTLYAGQRYWYNNARQIASSELIATKGAIDYIGTLAQAVVSNLSPTQVYQNSVIQYQNQTYTGGSARTSVLANLISLISGASFTVTATSTLGSLITASSTSSMTVGMLVTASQVPTITVAGYQTKTGTGPYYVTLVIPSQTTAPVIGTTYTVAGNSNSSYNGNIVVYASTTSSITLSYPTDPGAWGGGTTTVSQYLGGITGGNSYYITEITDSTHFKMSTSVGGSSITLQDANVPLTLTFDGIISNNILPANVPVTLSDAPDTLKLINASITTSKASIITLLGTFVNSNYPYINNANAITRIIELFKIVTDTLQFSLANRPIVSLIPPAGLTPANVSAATLLVANNAFIAAETVAWIEQNKPSGWVYKDVDGKIQWEKYVQLFVEAVAYDTVYGGNSGTTTMGNQFWLKSIVNNLEVATSMIDSEEMAVKISSLAHAQELSTRIIDNNTTGRIYQSDTPGNLTFVSKVQDGLTYKVTVIIPTRVVPIPVGTKVTFTGNSNTAYNGNYIVSASNTTSITVTYSSDPGVWSVLTPTTFIIGQFTNGALENGIDIANDIDAEWINLANIIENNPPNLAVITPDLTNSVYANTGYVAVKATITANAVNVSKLTTTYLNNKYTGGFSYNEATCRRDVGYIIDAMRIDLLTGGTYQSIGAGKSYYKNASAKSVAIGSQYTETVDGIQYARTVALQVLNQATASRYQVLLEQTTDGTKNANRGYDASATYVSNSGTSLTVSGVTGTVLVGMTVTGTGFISGQVVTAVDGTNITLSAAADSTPSGSLAFSITAIQTFTNNMKTLLSIITDGFGAAPTANPGSGVFTIRFTNGGNGYVDQCPPGDYNILPGKILAGITSGATANILSYTPGGSNNVDTITCQLLTPGFFSSGEQLEYAESVGALQITIHVESGVYYEDYPIRLPANVSIKGEEFRRTIVRPLDRPSQSPWRNLFFYRDAVIDGMQLGTVDTATDYAPNTTILSVASKTLVSGTTYDVVFNIPTQTYKASTSLAYTIAGNTTLAYNGTFTCTASNFSTITLRYPVDPGTFSTTSVTTINRLVTANISSTSGKIIITLSSNTQASVQWLGYVFQSDVLDSNGQPGRAVIDSVSGNFMNCTVMYPFTQTGTMVVNYTNAGPFVVGETITQSTSSSVATGKVLVVNGTSITYQITSGIMSTSNGAVTGGTSSASASVSSIIVGNLDPTQWHLYTTKNYGRHYLTDPLDPKSIPKNNRDNDVFLCGDAVRVNNLTMQGHGGFAMVLDPEGQIKSKSPYGQVATSFSRSVNKQTFAGGQFVDGFAGRLFGQITNVSTDGYTVTVTGGVNSGLDVRAPQYPCAFFVRGGRYQVNTVSNYTQTFDINGNVIGGQVILNLGAATPWLEGTGQKINIEMAGNKSMLANDFAMVNDLGYAIVAANGGITEQVSTFTYYTWTAFWALNGGQIRSVGSSSAHGQYALRATGYDVTEKPDSVELAHNLMQAAKIYNPVTSAYYNSMIPTGISVYIYGYDYYPTQISELEIDHTLAGKGIVRYQVNSISHTTSYVNTGSVGSNYRYVSTTYTAAGSSGTTLKVASTTGVVVGMTVTGAGFTRNQKVTAVSLDGVTLTLNGAPSATPVNGQALVIGDTVTISGATLGGISSRFTANTIKNSNYLNNVSTLAAVRTSPALLITGFVSKTPVGDGTYTVIFNIPTQASSPSVTTGYVVAGFATSSYNGTLECTYSTTTTITLKYLSDPGTLDSTATNSGYIFAPGGTSISSYGSAVAADLGRYNVTLNIPTQTIVPLVGGLFTVSGNSNAAFNGTFICTASTVTSLTLLYPSNPGAYGTGTTTFVFLGATIEGPNIPFGTTAIAVKNGNQIIMSAIADATASGSTYSSNAGNDITAYVTGLTNTSLRTFTFTGNAVSGGSGYYENLMSVASSNRGVYASFNVTVSGGVYTSVTIGGQNVLLLTLSTSGSNGTSSTGLAASLYDNQLVQLRVLQNFKFYEIDNVNPTRPSTAVQFIDNLGAIYRVLSYNLTEATNEVLPQYQAVLSTDQSYNYYLFQADTSNVTAIDPVDPTKTLGSKPGDVRIAVTAFGPQSNIDQINKGTYAFVHGGKVFKIASYTPPVTTSVITGYNPTGSSGTTLVVGGTFTGTITGTATITSVSSFTGLVVGEAIVGYGVPAGTTIISINQSASTVSLSAATVATGTGVTFKYGGTTGIITTMIISGTGFVNGQAVSAIVANTIVSANIADSVGTLTVTSGSYFVGQSITITGTNSGGGTITGYTTGTTYYVGKVNSSTSIQITSTYAKAIASTPVLDVVTTAGNPTGWTFSLISNTITTSVAPSATPSGVLTFLKSSVPYITLNTTSLFNIAGTDATAITITRPTSRGQVIADVVPTGSLTANTTSGSARLLGASSLAGLSTGTSIAGAGIPSTYSVTAVSTTSPSTITLSDASNVVVGNTIVFEPNGTTFGGIPQPGMLTTSTTFTTTIGLKTSGTATYTSVKAKTGNSTGSGALFTIVKTGSGTDYASTGLISGSTTYTTLTGTSVTGAATYSGINPSATSGAGTGASFNVTKTGSGTSYSGVTTITVVNSGTGYVVGDTITLPGASLGGATPANNLTFTLATSVAKATVVTMTTPGVNYTVGQTITVSGADIGGSDGTNDLTFTVATEVGQSAYYVISKATNAITIGKTLGGSAITGITTTTGSITGRTDNLVVSTASTVTFTANTSTTSPNGFLLTNVPNSAYTDLVLGKSVSGIGIGAGATIQAFGYTGTQGTNTITLSVANASAQTGTTVTVNTNTIVIGGAASATATGASLTYNTLSPTIRVYTSNTTPNIAVGMTVFGNGFTSGQTVVSNTPATDGSPYTTLVLTAAPDSRPFGTLGFTTLSKTTGPWYSTFEIPTQTSAPVVDVFDNIAGNSNTGYNKGVQVIKSSTTSVTVAYLVDPESTVVVTYNPTGSTGVTLKVSGTTGISVGMLVRGIGFYGDQKVTNVDVDGVTLTLSSAPSSTPTGSLTFTAPYGTGATTITPVTTGISRPMSTLIATPLRAGYLAGTGAQITTRISTCRATAHDLLDIGTGGYNTTNYPYQIYGNPYQKAKQENEILEETVGRVFYVTTDQNGIFRVGRFFTVDQGTGTVTFSASIALSNLDGLGFKRGVTVSEFSTDSTMTNDASDTVPTQSAVRAYIDNRLGIQHSGASTSATALIGPGFMPLSGQLPMKGNMSMGGFTIGSMGLPLLATDAATKLYVDTTVNDQDSLFKVKDTAKRMGGTIVNGQILVYGTGTQNNNLTTGAWANASFDPSSDFNITWDGTTLRGVIQGAVVSTTYASGGATAITGTFSGSITDNLLTVTSPPTITIVKGMLLSGGVLGNQIAAGTYIVDYKTGIGAAGTYIVSQFQTVTTITITGTTIPLTVNSTAGLIPGMIVTGTGFSNQYVTGVVNSTIVNISAVGTTPAGTIVFTRNGAIVDGEVSATAAIAQSKLAMNLATTTAAAPNLVTVNAGSFVVGKRYRISSTGSTNWSTPGTANWVGATSGAVGTIFQAVAIGSGNGQAIDLDAVQATTGVASYDDAQFTITDGWITVRTSTSTATGIPAAKLQWITGNSVLANIGGSNGAVSVVTTQAMVANGDGVRNQDIPSTTGTGIVGSLTGVVTRIGSKAYDCVPITTTGGNDSMVKTNNNGVIDVKGIKLGSLPSAGGVIFQVATTTLEFYTPGNVKFAQSSGNTTATTTYYGTHDFSTAGTTLQSKTLSAGLYTDTGTITGPWGVSANSQIDFSLGTLKTRTITTGADGLSCDMTGTFTLTGASKLQATYAGDLAEYYEGDAEYEPGTVLVFGGEKEVSTTDQMNDTRVAGVVSTDAAYTMFGACPGLKNLIALAGRVPCKVVGRVKKGDLLTTSSIPGYACKAIDPKLGSIVGKALEDKDNGEAGVIQAAIGRL